MAKARPYRPADIGPWGDSIERDTDSLLSRVGSVEENVAAAQQGVASISDALVDLRATSRLTEAAISSDVTVGSGWLANTSNFFRPSVIVENVTGRIEVNYGGAIRNGSGRILFSVTDVNTGQVLVNHLDLLTDYSTTLALTGSVSFPCSGFNTRVIEVSGSTLAVTLEVNGSAVGVVLSGARLAVRPTI